MDIATWITLGIQAIGTAVMVGFFLQQHKEYARRIKELEDEKVSREIFDRLEHYIGDMDKRIRQMEERTWGRGRGGEQR